MYLDFIKNDYSDLDCNIRDKYIERDKKHLGTIIQQRISNDLENIIERWYQLEDIGCSLEKEKFLDLLKEAENLFCFGYYTGTISLIGIASEEFVKYIFTKNNIDKTECTDTQFEKLKYLKNKKILNLNLYKSLNSIRITRNHCMHYSRDFKTLSENELLNNAKITLLEYKKILKELVTFKDVNFNKIIENVVKDSKMTFNEFKMKQRNINKINLGLDLQLPPEIKQKTFTKYYYIQEIDDIYKEITLLDIDNGLPVCIDLTLPQAKMINDLKLTEGNIILATIMSSVSTIGQTEEWLLINLADVFKGIYEF